MWFVAVAASVVTSAAITRFVPAITVVEVDGNVHHAASDVMRIARVAPGDPFLWTTRWRMAGLALDPWIAAALVERRWPDAVTIRVFERTPFAWDGNDLSPTVWARDATVLPGTTPDVRARLPIVTGWGPARLEEALAIVDLLRGRDVSLVEWHPEGFAVHVDGKVVATPSLDAVQRAWAAVDRSDAGPTSVYPWGASVANE